MEIIEIEDDKALEYKSYVIYGAGDVGKMVCKWLKRNKKRILSFCDGNSLLWKKRINGIFIQSPDECIKRYQDAIFIVANVNHYKAIVEKLELLGVEKVIICNSLYKIKKLYILTGRYAMEDNYYIYDAPMQADWKTYIDARIFRISGNIKKRKMSKEQEALPKKYGVSLCLIFFNEANYLKEWIEYHRIVGVDHFYLYDNLSTDNSMEILQPYIEEGVVEVIEWPDRPGQMTAYIDCARRHKEESDWIGFIDTDEFIVPVKNDNIKDFLAGFRDRGSVLINWKYFGYDGHISRNIKNLVTEDFTQTTKKYSQLGKCFWNTRYAYRDDNPENMWQIHWLYTVSPDGRLNPLVNCFDEVCNEKYQFAKKEEFPIQINHYMNKSYEEYCERKKHGSAMTADGSYRNINQFYQDESLMNSYEKFIFKYLGKLKSKLY